MNFIVLAIFLVVAVTISVLSWRDFAKKRKEKKQEEHPNDQAT